MAEERTRNEPGRHDPGEAERHVERHDGGGEPDFEGHGNRGGDRAVDRVVDRHDSGDEPDFEGHRFVDRNVERHVERAAD